MAQSYPSTGGALGGQDPTDSGTAQQAKDQAQQVAGQAKDQVQQVAGQAKEQAQQAAGQAKGQVKTQVDQRSTQVGQQVATTASDLKSVSQALREQGKDQPAKFADQAAERAERVGNYLQQADADRLIGDIEDFARKNPWGVVAGGIAVGFLASRFVKASSSQRFEQSLSRPSEYGTPRVGNGYSRPTTGYESPALPPRTGAGTTGTGLGTTPTTPPIGGSGVGTGATMPPSPTADLDQTSPMPSPFEGPQRGL